MTVVEILEEIKNARGSKAKIAILKSHTDNELLKQALKYGLDHFIPFYIIKVPSVPSNKRQPACVEKDRWNLFFDIASLCANRSHTGYAAIELMSQCFSSVTAKEEKWMRRILKKHLAIGASGKTVNKVFSGLIPTFEVSLAQKFETKRLSGKEYVGVEPKLDGIRCFAIVENRYTKLFARSGKLISNFDDTIGHVLAQLGDGCYDGEIMGDDFISLMRQAYRKEDVDVSRAYMMLFDFLPLGEWKSGKAVMTCTQRYDTLVQRVMGLFEASQLKHVGVVERQIVPASYPTIKELHDKCVSVGHEGVMVKDLDAPYRFGRGYEVMKLKDFHDTDVKIIRVEEGTGKFKGMCGSLVVDYKGVEVGVGSGLDDQLRNEIWRSAESFVGRMVEVRYQEVTPDGSLRFPTFVCFRNDRG